jgi:peroxiredoxin
MSSRSSFVHTFGALFMGTALTLTLVACGGGSGAGAASGNADGSLVGQQAPDFTAETVTGDGPKSVKEANGKVTIIDFWATYCGPCKKSFPKYQELIDQFGGDLAVLAVSVDEKDTGKAALEEFVKATDVKFAVVWDKEHSAADAYKPPKMPTAFIVDKGGIVRHIHAGYGEGEEQKIADEIKALIEK